ncbi:diaminopimelate decarboxylase [Candidatus Pelagibacter sp. RS40]|uniref:diaminopimelate decarboxylase n=1 Tax=Candidatus Pelagibacter sp. RS40 TaxID=1977865 RepID=UPI000A146D89|nr:diaminopimelate decarboxylase [Candidatus Pelagibacter sp. RS40]ARJ49117.1 diaminopimelate decarboxylase [Candidatus Pelagibacter sp. RS40]
MRYKNNNYFFENISLDKLAIKYSTPLYCYSYNKLKSNIVNFFTYFKKFSPLVCFAIKSNTNLNLIREIKNFGLGADVVSKGELMLALKAGINKKKIVFSGVGKTESELKFAIEKKILLINSESESEIKIIEKIAKKKNVVVNIGIRLNPNTDANTLKQISTGKKENKFGVDEKTFLKLVSVLRTSKNIKLKCLSVHIGSQITDHKPYEKMLKAVDKIINKAKFNFEYIDLGGGMGISYEKNQKKLDYKKYKSAIEKFLRKNNSKLIFEPGRSIIGNTAILISRVIYLKETSKKIFVILDAGMNDMMRPALYGAKHQILPAFKNKKKSQKSYEFVGPICETTDKFLSVSNFNKLKERDLIFISDVGAYGSSLSSNYNIRPKPSEILINKSKITILKKRQKLEDII